MNRLLFGLLYTTAIWAVTPNPAMGQELTLRWHGQSFFEIISPQGVRIAVDPHQIESYSRKQIEADLILISHLHSDHMQTTAISNKDKCKSIFGLKVDPETRRQEWNLTQETFKDVSIEVLGAFHDNQQGFKRGKTGMFLIQIGKTKILHCGDLGHPLDAKTLKKIEGVDILLIPIGGVYTINGEEARAIMQAIKPMVATFPMHYGTKVYDGLLGPEEFLEEIPKASVETFTSNQWKLGIGLKTKEPKVIFLNYE